MVKEFCAENYASIPLAIVRGANRIGSCDNLTVGRATPSTGVVEEILSYTGEKNTTVMVIIRPRGDDFVYSDTELKIMHTDLIEAKKLGTDGVVFGCLAPLGWLDEGALELLIEIAEGVQITFHTAFDSIPEERQLKAIDRLAAHGVDRILTYGGPTDQAVEEYFPRLKELIDCTDGCLITLPGDGVAAASIAHVAKELNVSGAHRTKIVELQP